MIYIKKEEELKNNKPYYKIMKKTGFFSFWKEEFGSYSKKQTDNTFREMSKDPNIEVKN